MRINRRTFLGTTGAAGVGAAISTAGSMLLGADAAEAASTTIAFRGTHQAGIVTPPQAHLIFASYDMASSTRDDLVGLLQRWTRIADRMTQGLTAGDGLEPSGQPTDNGEAAGLDASKLTLTFGFGRSLFDDRFGLRDLRPEPLITLPVSSTDKIDPARSEGDIGVQICADSRQVAWHAFHNLTRQARPFATLRWSQAGFRSEGVGTSTPRNLQGFKDGTNNLKTTDDKLMNDEVWVGDGDNPAWMRGGSYLVTRRIRMLVESWDRTALSDQERIIGRHKDTGAPFGGKAEFDAPQLLAQDPGGKYVVPLTSHIRLASPDANNGAKLLRRSYSYSDGIDAANGLIDAGLFFVCYQRDLRSQFVQVQRRLMGDALSDFIRHTGSAAFACPAGVKQDGWIGQSLFSA